MRLGIAPVIGFYSLQTKHALTPKSRMSLALFLKREKSLDRRNQVFVSYGLEYLFHGVNYKSYFFTQDTLQLYDRSFSYSYNLFLHELQIPLQAKFAFNSTSNSKFSPYLSIGFHLRYFAGSALKINSDEGLIKTDNVDVVFKNALITKKLNSAAGISLGIQSNKTRSQNATFFIELSFKYGFSPYSFKENYSANAVYINSSHLALNLGIGF